MTENLHIAMIMDGNRRWAVEQGMSKLKGHMKGAEKLKEVLNWCKEVKVRALTLYTMSTENFKRPQEELDELFRLFRKHFKELLESKEVKENKVKIRFLGKLSLLPEDVQELMVKVTEQTKDYDGYDLNFCIGYGGRQEILNAVNKAVKDGNEVTEESFSKLLYLKDSPDLVIRTGGALRTSNFLPWQSAYSEWFFPKEYWPALTKELFLGILEQFKARKRNFGV